MIPAPPPVCAPGTRRIAIPIEITPRVQIRATGRIQTIAGETMGTTWSVKIAATAPTAASLRAGIVDRLDQVIEDMSGWLPSSALSRFNRASAGSWHRLPDGLLKVVDSALEIARDSDGAFDPTLGRLVELWGFGPGGTPGNLPPVPAIEAAARDAGWHRLRLDRQQRRALQPGGLVLDLSAIAKGFAVDQVAGHLESHGLHDWLIEIGGELRGCGTRPDGRPWWVALERPPECQDEILVALHGRALATTGDYRRYFERSGQRYGHTLDPRNGRPLRQGCWSVSVIHGDCMCADAYATAIAVLGPSAGLAFARQRGLAALLLVEQREGFVELMSPAFAAMLE